MPGSRRSWTASFDVGGKCRTELQHPSANGLIADIDSAFRQHFFHITKAQRKPKVEPNRALEDHWLEIGGGYRKSCAFTRNSLFERDRRFNVPTPFEMWYHRIFSFVDRYLIDRKNGGWFAELDDNLDPVQHVFMGKPDLYHALQASLIPLLPTNGSITKQLLVANGDEVLRGDFPG
jgi:hypothetical protein